MEKENKTKKAEPVKKIISKKKAPVRFSIFFTHYLNFFFSLFRLWVKSVFQGFRRFIFYSSIRLIIFLIKGVYIIKI